MAKSKPTGLTKESYSIYSSIIHGQLGDNNAYHNNAYQNDAYHNNAYHNNAYHNNAYPQWLLKCEL